MADEIPPAPSEASDDVTKSETIRITLPPKSEQPAVKRETVRINVPGKPVPPVGTAPKKETTKLPSGEAPTTPGAPPPPSTATKPFVPPPPAPRPPGAGLPTAPSGLTPPPKPLSGAMPPPKPPSLGARPTVPLKPAPIGATAGGPTPPPEPVTVKSAAPKKETARITLPPEGAKSPLPKATVKMQQTVPLSSPRPSGIQAAPATVMQHAPTLTAAAGPKADSLVGGLSIVACIAAIAAVVTTYLAYAETLPK
ncbi:MAG: hypothetical protein ABMA13_10815 [Chthoniobacteraceae bacterium]